MSDPRHFLHAAQREMLSLFVYQVFQTLHPGKHYYSNWHIDTLCWQLEQMAAGNITRLAVSMPPRSLKSIVVSVAYAAWLLGRDPTCRLICASYSQDLANKHARDFRRIMASLRYRELFPDTVIAGGRNTSAEQETSQNGFRYATSIGGTLTGRGGDYIIVDDTAKPGEAISEANRQSVNEWYSGELLSRLDNPSSGGIAVVMQRLHEDDLIGHVTAAEEHGWTLLNIPAIAPEDLEYRTGSRPQDLYLRREGEVIDARRTPLSVLDELRASMGTVLFNTQYQQEPMPLEGNLVRRSWLSRYEPRPPRQWYDCVIQSWDTASEAGELNDYSVCTTWGVKEGRLDLLDVFRRKLEFPALLETARRLALDHQANVILVERASSGNSLAQSLHSALNATVRSVPARGDKSMRLLNVSHLFETGIVRLPVEAHWLASYEQELLAFPSGRHDDQVDSTTQVLTWIKGKSTKSLRYAGDGRRVRPNPVRPSGRRRRLTIGPRSAPIDIFGTRNESLL